MKAFLLAGGHGVRLRPITDSLPKCLVPIQGVPLLSIWLQLCKSIGIDEVLINVHAHAEDVCNFLDRNSSGVAVRVVAEPQLLGSAGTLRANRKWVGSEDFFWVFYADVLSRADFSSMLRFHRQRMPAATLGLYEVPDPRRCGIVKMDEKGVIHEFVEKPEKPASNLAFSGLMIGTPELLDVIPEATPTDIGFDVLPKLTGRMLGFHIYDYLIDIGTMENYQHAQATWPGLPQPNLQES